MRYICLESFLLISLVGSYFLFVDMFRTRNSDGRTDRQSVATIYALASGSIERSRVSDPESFT